MMPMPPPPRRSAGDRAAAVVLTVLAGLAALASVGFSLFFVMAGDSCGVNECSTSRLVAAYVVTWGGAGAAGILAIVGMVSAERRHKVMWIWPMSALILVAVTFAAGVSLAMSMVR